MLVCHGEMATTPADGAALGGSLEEEACGRLGGGAAETIVPASRTGSTVRGRAAEAQLQWCGHCEGRAGSAERDGDGEGEGEGGEGMWRSGLGHGAGGIGVGESRGSPEAPFRRNSRMPALSVVHFRACVGRDIRVSQHAGAAGGPTRKGCVDRRAPLAVERYLGIGMHIVRRCRRTESVQTERHDGLCATAGPWATWATW